jgi:hypothetical protein
MKRLFILVPTNAQVQKMNEEGLGGGDDSHVSSTLHVINKFTVYPRILHDPSSFSESHKYSGKEVAEA